MKQLEIHSLEKYNKILQEVLNDIKSLKIQGATNVAIEGVKSFSKYAYNTSKEFRDYDAFLKHIIEKSIEVKNIRVTEPALANGLEFVIQHIKDNGVETALDASDKYLELLSSARTKVAEIGAEKIYNDTTIMTHCHSSFVDTIFWLAMELGKKFTVVNTETRPLFQGRKTVRKLREKGINVIHVVDSAMWWAMHKFDVDLILIGADAVTVEGVALNKIGSRLLALSARELHVPLYVCTTLLKYNPDTRLGRRSEIEMRESEEIWPEHPEGVSVINPAFESIASQYISAYITEYGLIPPQMMTYYFDNKIINGVFRGIED